MKAIAQNMSILLIDEKLREVQAVYFLTYF